MTSKEIWLPNASQVAEMHNGLTALFADEDDPISPPGIRDAGLLESACNRPHTGIGDHEKYTTQWQKFAALFHSLTKSHAFHNGNKRVSIVALLTVLYRNDYRFGNAVGDDEIYDLALRVTADTFPSDESPAKGDDLVHELARWLCEQSESTTAALPGMRTTLFLDRCKDAGCSVKAGKNGGRWVVQNHGLGGVTFSQSTQELSGNVIKNYLRRLGLTASSAGVFGGEFQEGPSGERAEMHRYIIALRRLAKT